MRKTSKLILVAGAVAALAVPSAAMAVAPTGTYQEALAQKTNTVYTDAPNSVAEFSSRVIHNGQWVSGNNELAGNPDYPWASESPSKGARAAYVRGLLGH